MAKTRRKPPEARSAHRKIRVQQTIFFILAGLVIASFLLSMFAR
jgi:hypothetical protein